MIQERKERKDKILNFVNLNNRIKLDSICGKFSQDTGIKASTIEVYIKELESAGLLFVRAGFVYKIIDN